METYIYTVLIFAAFVAGYITGQGIMGKRFYGLITEAQKTLKAIKEENTHGDEALKAIRQAVEYIDGFDFASPDYHLDPGVLRNTFTRIIREPDETA